LQYHRECAGFGSSPLKEHQKHAGFGLNPPQAHERERPMVDGIRGPCNVGCGARF
jgi:hypothetical protein